MPSASSPADLHIANNLRLASGDLTDAMVLRKQKSRNAAYLAQQAVEKLLLALLVSENLERTRAESHRLDILVEKLPPNNGLRQRLSQLSYLAVFATTFRYPKDGGRLPSDPDWDRLDQSIALAGELIDEASRHFGVDLAGSDRIPAGRIARSASLQPPTFPRIESLRLPLPGGGSRLLSPGFPPWKMGGRTRQEQQ